MYEEEKEMEVTEEEIERELSDTDRFLGDAFRIPRSGIVRPGIMVPKKGCPDKLIVMYQKMVKEERQWDEIDKAMGKDAEGKSWLTMTNVDYFTLRPCDCTNPEHAALIKKLYADKDGILRRIPVSFPVNDASLMHSVNLSCYGASGKKHQGRYIRENLFCETPKVEQKGGKEVKRFGPPKMERKACNPNECVEYQKGDCKLRGGFMFRIPNIPGLGVWCFYSPSWHTMVGIRSTLKVISDFTKDKCNLTDLSGYFYLAKVKAKVGRPLRWQYIVTLDTDYPLEEVLAQVERKKELGARKRLSVSGAALSLLNGKPKNNGSEPAKDSAEVSQVQSAAAGAEKTMDVTDVEVEKKNLNAARTALNQYCSSEKLTSESLKRCAQEQRGKALSDMNSKELNAFTSDVKTEIKKDKKAWVAKWDATKESPQGKEDVVPTAAQLHGVDNAQEYGMI